MQDIKMQWSLIHIPKTGATGLEKDTMKCGIHGGGHKNTEKVLEKKYKVFVIIRDPVDRMFSQFYYWKQGSSSSQYRRSEFQITEHNKIYPNLTSFIFSLQHGSVLARAIINTNMGFTWSDHFAQQMKWLDGTHENTYLICYDKNTLSERVNDFFQHFNINCTMKNSIVNPTKVHMYETLPLDQERWIRKRYSEDFSLWDKCKGRDFVKF